MFRFSRARKKNTICRKIFRPRLERLEERALLTAGLLDPDFGTGGLVVTDLPGSLHDFGTDLVVTQPDGKSIVLGNSDDQPWGGSAALARYLEDGRLDETFGDGGRVLIDFSENLRYLSTELFGSVAVTPDGKIVVGGRPPTWKRVRPISPSSGSTPAARSIRHLPTAASPASTWGAGTS